MKLIALIISLLVTTFGFSQQPQKNSTYYNKLIEINKTSKANKELALLQLDSLISNIKTVQDEKVTLIKAYRIKASLLKKLEQDSVLWYYDKAVSTSKNANLDAEWVRSMKRYAVNAKSKKKFTLADSLYNMIFSDPYVKENETLLVSIIADYSSLLLNQNKIDEAVSALQRALEIAEKNNYHKDDNFLYNRLAYFYFQLKDYEKSILYYKQLINLEEDSDITVKKSIWNSIAGTYLMLEQLDSSKHYIQKVLDGNPSKSLQLYCQQYLSSIAVKEENFEVGLRYANECTKLSKELNFATCECDFSRVTCLNKLGMYRKSQKLLDEIQSCMRTNHTKSYQNSAKIYELDNSLRLIGRSDLAQMVDTIIYLQDSLSTTNARKQLLNAETKYQTQKKEAENQLLKKDNALAAAQITKQRTMLGGSGAVLLSLGLLIWNLVSRGKERKKNINALTEKNEAIQALNSEIAHRTKNHLALATALLSKDRSSSDDPAVKASLADNENRLRTLTLVNQKLNQASASKELNLKDYLQELCDDLMFGLEKTRASALSLNCPDLNIDSEKVLRLGLITNELITNSFKHAHTSAQALNIDIEIARQGTESILYSYSDNGEAQELTPTLDSKGIGLIDNLWLQLHGDYKQSFSPHYRLKGTLAISS